MHQIFFKARKLIIAQRNLIYAHDELRMAASRLRLATEYEPGGQNSVLHEYELHGRLEVRVDPKKDISMHSLSHTVSSNLSWPSCSFGLSY